jgi:hypothetical protein
MVDLALIGSITGLISFSMAVVTFLYQRFKVNSDMNTRLTVLENRQYKDYSNDISSIKERLIKLESREDTSKKIDEICERLSASEVKNELIWGAVEKAVVDILHHPTQIEKDTLLEKLLVKDISPGELENLTDMLVCDTLDKKDSPESIAAALLLARIEQLRVDKIWRYNI